MYELIVIQTQVSPKDHETKFGYSWSYAFYDATERANYILECIRDTELANTETPESEVLLSFIKNDTHTEFSAEPKPFIIPSRKF